ncbi:MAG: protein kinase [Abditibacteriales bacterium]|nr:protein kinase [Abditibacteriales bacterium]MDW8366891.1 protein kinase [Abditibacteriales bacterium]
MIGKKVREYTIIAKIGEGGMGQVFRAEDNLKRNVAIKLLHRDLMQDSQKLERFQSEAITLGKLNHPNIATLYAFFEHEGDWYMVMEFVDGETFESLIKRQGAMPARRALELLDQALQGLEHAHAKQVIHRDIKPGNLMLNSAGLVKITDFGIARMLGTKRMTQTGTLIGTLEYISPEQVKGGEPDERSDIYALGVMFYEMVTGRVPFSSVSEFEIMRKHLEEKPPPPRTLQPGLPVEVERIIQKALEKDPAARFQTAREMRKMVQQALAHLPQEAAAPATRLAETPTLSGRAPAQKGFSPKLLVGGGAAAAVILIVAGAVVMGGGKKQDTTPSQDSTSRTTVTSEKKENPPPTVTGSDQPSNSQEDVAKSETPKKEESGASDAGTSPAVNPNAAPVVVKKFVTEKIPFKTETRMTDDLPRGQQKVKQDGQPGVKTITVEVTLQGGREISRRTVSAEVTKPPVNKIVLVGTAAPKRAAAPSKRKSGGGEASLPPRLGDDEPSLPPSIGR